MTFDSPLSAWQYAVDHKGFIQDEAQEHAVWALHKCHEALRAGARSVSGVYLWGPVGRGKTWLMDQFYHCLLYTSPSPRDGLLSRMPSSA